MVCAYKRSLRTEVTWDTWFRRKKKKMPRTPEKAFWVPDRSHLTASYPPASLRENRRGYEFACSINMLGTKSQPHATFIAGPSSWDTAPLNGKAEPNPSLPLHVQILNSRDTIHSCRPSSRRGEETLSRWRNPKAKRKVVRVRGPVGHARDDMTSCFRYASKVPCSTLKRAFPFRKVWI